VCRDGVGVQSGQHGYPTEHRLGKRSDEWNEREEKDVATNVVTGASLTKGIGHSDDDDRNRDNNQCKSE